MFEQNIIKCFKDEYSWLSNFYECNLRVGSTVEHAYQASKFVELEIQDLILNAPTPGRAKRLGRKYKISVLNFDNIKIDIMHELLLEKFNPITNFHLNTLLLQTGDAYIEEGNTWGDTFWGIDMRTGKGINVLGNLLMNIRTHYKRRR